MVQSHDMEKPNFADDLRKIRIMSFASYKKSLLYAGEKKNKYNNWALAASFAQANNMYPIQATEGGQYISIPDREKDLKYSGDQYKKVWDRASVKYCVNIEGAVKTFICGSRQSSTFRRKEIHAMLKSHTIDDINGKPHSTYAERRRAVLKRLNEEDILPQPERHKRAINSVFRAIAFQEIRQDLALAREQNNASDITTIFARVGHLRTQQHEDFENASRSKETKKLAEQYSIEEEISHANPDMYLLHSPQKLAHG